MFVLIILYALDSLIILDTLRRAIEKAVMRIGQEMEFEEKQKHKPPQ